MVHAIEAYASKSKNNNPISRMMAIEALKLLGGSIEKSVFRWFQILEARGQHAYWSNACRKSLCKFTSSGRSCFSLSNWWNFIMYLMVFQILWFYLMFLDLIV